ncbi:unnamed protein product [Arctia plantaginis]|uniref:Uncharacterized protein n=1 Tax=Arctia plantaginis TaxID=874455 RepID=A0A8S1BVU0_ARCPL|nr:unnamed protein product [Arctia plantaginis]
MDEAYFSFEFNELDKSMLTGPSNRRTHLITYNRTADRNLSHLNHDARQARPTISNSGPAKTRTSENKRNADGNLNHFARQTRPTTGNSGPAKTRTSENKRNADGNLNHFVRQARPTTGNSVGQSACEKLFINLELLLPQNEGWKDTNHKKKEKNFWIENI